MNTLGKQAETDALAFLKKKQLRCRDRNFRTPWGELDLVVESRDGVVIFVEVKARIASPVGSSLEQIDTEKIRRLKRAIAVYVHQHTLHDRPLRLDGIGIEYTIDEPTGSFKIQKIEHIEDLTGW